MYVCVSFYFSLDIPPVNILKSSEVDAAAHSENGILIRCDIGAKPVGHSELECLMW
jgi:hypothetical protein